MTAIVTWTTFPFGITESMKTIMARREWVFVQTAADLLPSYEVPTATASWDVCHALNLDLRARNPKIKIGLYAWGPANNQGYSPMYPWVGPEMCLHHPDGSPVWAPYPANNPYTKMVNLGNATWRTMLIDGWIAMMSDPAHPYDGLIFDSWFPQGIALQMAAMAGDGALPSEGGTGPLTWLWWFAQLALFTRDLRWALEQRGKVLLVNGVSLQAFDPTTTIGGAMGQNYVNLADYASGVLAEHVHRMRKDEATFWATLDMLRAVIGKRRMLYLAFWPALFPFTDPGYAGPVEGQDLEQFYLAAYKLIEEPPYTLMSYHVGSAYVGGMHGQPYVWDSPDLAVLDALGHPIGALVTDNPSGAAWRPFSGGIAIVNPSTTFKSIRLDRSARFWHPTTGGLVTVEPGVPGYFNAAPMTGTVLFYV